MKTTNQSKDGVIYQIEDHFEEVGTVIVDITYSGGEDENGNEILEFEYSSVEADTNPNLTEDQIRICNKILECGYEETYVVHLKAQYENSGILFDVGEWKHVPFSVLYDETAN